MPSTYQRQHNRRIYGTSTEKNLLRRVEEGGISIRAGSEKYCVRKSTLSNALKKKHTKKPGGQCMIVPEDEGKLAEFLDSLADWGYPVGLFELRQLAKNMLEKQKVITKFKNNMP